MRLIAQLAAFAAAAATLANANTITFKNQDDTKRHLVFTPNNVESVDVAGNDEITVEFPTGWIGNAYSVSEGNTDKPGMLAEVAFQGWDDLTYFDVSAIVDPSDHIGVKQLYPANEITAAVKTKISGCLVFPCSTAYYLPNDLQTVTTPETDLICTLGGSGDVETREVETELVSRNYVLGKL